MDGMQQHESNPRALLTYAEAAARLGIPRATLYVLVSQRRIPHVRYGRRFVRFDAAQLAAWVDDHRVVQHSGYGKGSAV